jgi:hypothetical protein
VFCNGGIQQKCKAGRYGASGGLPGSDCDGPCAPGYYCPEGSTSRYAALCGGVHVYCPSGSGAPVAAPASGFYTGPLTVAENRRYTINACPSDKSCEFGKIIEPLEYYSCPAGTLDRKVAELITSAPAGNPVDARLRAGKTGTITYSIISQTWNAGCRYGPNGNVFAIDGAGQIKLNNRQINYNDCQQFTIVTQAAFGTSIGKCTVTIDVVDKNEMPSATCGNRDVREKVAAGTLVGSPMSASDPDKGQSLIWSIVSSTPAGAPFAIGPCDGQLVVKKGGADLDYAKATAYTMTLAVKDDGSPSMSVQCTMRIDIINVNEPPTFEKDLFTLSIEENRAAGTVVDKVVATDPDGVTDVLTYSWAITDSPDHFVVNSATGEITVKSGAAVNFEKKPKYTYTLQVLDPSKNKATTTVAINIVNTADPPVINDQAGMSVIEGAATGVKVGVPITATDEDVGDTLTFSTTSSYFTISADGQLSVKAGGGALIDFETSKSLDVPVKVVDSFGEPAYKTFKVAVTDANEQCTLTAATRTIPENADIGTAVGGGIEARDPDANTILMFSLVSGMDDKFSIDSGTGQIRVAKTLDFETKASYSIVVRATDNGVPQKYCQNTVTVTVEDTTEPPVIADQAVTVSEGLAAGALVKTVIVTDADVGDTHTCEIVDGNIGGMLTLEVKDAAAGTFNCKLLVGSGGLDFETASSLNVKIRAADSTNPPNYGSGYVKVTITNVNEKPIVSDSILTRAVASGAVKGSKVGVPIKFSDPDVGQSHTWKLNSLIFTKEDGTTTDYKSIMAVDSTGQILVNVASLASTVQTIGFSDPDFEASFTVTDNGSPALSESYTTKIQIVSGNKAPTLNAATFAVKENAASGTVLGTLTATDPDGDVIGNFTIVTGNEQGRFVIDTKTGKISLLGSLDFESASSYTLLVQCQDSPPMKDINGQLVEVAAFTAEAKVIISVQDVNEAPTLAGAEFTLNENVPVGTVVGKSIDMKDQDKGDKGTFAITAGNTNSVFRITSSSRSNPDGSTTWFGQLYVDKAAIDYEKSDSYNLQVKVTDAGGLSATASIIVTIADMNDAPVIGTLTPLVVAENVGAGSDLPSTGVKVPVTDQDGDGVTLRLVGGDAAGTFKLSADGQLTLAKGLNYEATTKYTLQLQATDGRNLAGPVVEWPVQVSNVWEKPVYTGPTTASVAENTAKGTEVFRATCTDEDKDLAGYYFQKDSTVFSIDKTTGVVTVSGLVNYEEASSHSLVVVCDDAEGLTASQTVTVSIINVNEPPVIATTSLGVKELSVVGAEVGKVSIVDEDPGDTHTIKIMAGNGPSNDYFTVSGPYIYLKNAKIDYEGVVGAKKFSLDLLVEDSGTPMMSARKYITIDVLDQNEPPVMHDQVREVEENSLTNTPVGDILIATDPDIGQLLTFKILSGAGDLFKIDPCSGQIKIDRNKGLDFETKNQYTLVVQVQDDGPATPGPARLSDTATITINVIDVNENPSLDSSTIAIDENLANGNAVGAPLQGQDPENSPLTFEIISGNTGNAFSVGKTTGQIAVATTAALDFETTPKFVLTVRVTDDGKPDGIKLSGEGTITVTLNDVNEKPVFLAQTREVKENSPGGTLIGAKLAARDPDAGQTVSFVLESGLDADKFVITADGQLKVAPSNPVLDFETTPTLTVKVRAIDSAPSPLFEIATITIALSDVNEAPSLSAASYAIDENSQVGTAITASANKATDVDRNERLTYSLVSQTPNNAAFRVLANDGTIEVKTALIDFERYPTHTLTVLVKDAGGLTDQATITINVQNVNEAPSISNQARAVDENANDEAVGVALIATDPELPTDTLTFSLLTSKYSSKFVINGATGAISTASGANLDHETVPSVPLTVQVKDSGGLTATATVMVTVRDVNEAPFFSQSAMTVQVSENAEQGTGIATITAKDWDVADTLTYSMIVTNVGADPAARASDLTIDSATGTIRVAKDTGTKSQPASVRQPLYLPQDNRYTVRVTATDDGAGLLAASMTLTIVVIETNDPPELLSLYSASVKESVPGGSVANTLVHTLQAIENDPADRNKVTYTILGGNYADTFRISTVTQSAGVVNTGEIRVAKPIINFEERSNYTLLVQASDGFLTTTTRVNIVVEDVNEAPVIDAQTLTMSVDENPASIGITVGSVKANDVDAGDVLSFAFFGDGNKAGHFAINKDTGVVSVASLDIDRETTSSYSIGVRVTDVAGAKDEKTLSILVNNVNDAPVLPLITVSGPENSLSGSAVAASVRAMDQDTSDRHTYKMGAGNCWGASVSQSGVRSFAPFKVRGPVRTVDFSVKASTSAAIVMRDHAGSDSEYSKPTGSFYEITLGDSGSKGAVLRRVIASGGSFDMTVVDPVAADATFEFVTLRKFTRYTVAVDSSSASQTVVSLVSAADGIERARWVDTASPRPVGERFGMGAASSKSAVDVNPACFAPASASTAEGVFTVGNDGAIKFSDTTLNYEQQRQYGFEIVVTDDGSPSMTSSSAVVFSVQDVNEVMQWATTECSAASSAGYAKCFSIPENTLPTAAAAIMGSIASSASDPDVLAKQTLSFQLGPDGNSFNDKSIFAVHTSTGSVSLLQNALDFERRSVYELDVIAKDNGVPQLSNSAKIRIDIVDVNEAPTILSSVFDIKETSAEGADVGETIQISDPDFGDDHVVEIVGGNGPSNDWFRIEGRKLRLGKAKLDYEQVKGARSFTLTLKVTDIPTDSAKAPGPLSTTKTVTVRVLDENEPPVIEDAFREVEENSPVNTPVGDFLPASDEDEGQTLLYRITKGNDQGLFKIDACSGQVKVSNPGLDFETQNQYVLEITVTDDGGDVPGPPRLSDTATLTITIIDVNEPPTLDDITVEVKENSPVATTVGAKLVGHDVDAGTVLTYEIVGGNTGDAFAVDASSGQISVMTSVIDFETLKKYVLNVTVTDNGMPSGPQLSGWGLVTVNVLDVNEAPIFKAQTRAVNENSASGVKVGAVLEASDVDAGDVVTFKIVGGADASKFTISSQGQLVVADNAALDFETQSVLKVTVRASDDDASPLTTDAVITIQLLDVNERPFLPQITLNINENSPIGTVVANSANHGTDVDAGDVLKYSMVSQSPGSFFRVLGADGTVEVRAPGVDFETSRTHTLLIRVEDKAGLTYENQFVIQVNDMNEAPVIEDQTRHIAENSVLFAVEGGALIASDVDASDSPYTTGFEFAILSGAGQNFVIDKTSGVISTSATAQLNFEKQTSHELVVQVKDSGGLTDSGKITIVVEDVNEVPTFSTQSFQFSAAENAKFEQQVDIVTATDVDANNVLTYSLEVVSVPAGGKASDFKINPSNGKVFVARATAGDVPDKLLGEYFPQNTQYEYRVRVEDNGANKLSAVAPVTINIIPYNDPPQLADNSPVMIKENSAINTLVATLQGSDNDDDDVLSYEIIGGNFADTFKISTVSASTGHNFAEVRLARPETLNFEARPFFNLVVQVTDQKLRATANLPIIVEDVNEAPVIDAQTLTMSVDENPASIGITVGSVKANDVDAGDVLSFAFFGDGNKAGHFAINKDTGVVSVASLDIDRETTSSYSIGVRVTDVAGAKDEKTLSILVNDVNDAPVLGDSLVEVNENLLVGSAVGTVRATDDDARDRHTYKMGRTNCWFNQAVKLGQYYYAPLPFRPAGSVQFEASVDIRGAQEARIALAAMSATDSDYSRPTGSYYQITIGANGGDSIRVERCAPSCVNMAAPTSAPGIITEREFRSFWFAVDMDGTISVGRGTSRSESDETLVVLRDTDSEGFVRATRVGVAAGASAIDFSSICLDNAATASVGVFSVNSDGSIVVATSSPNYEAQREYGFEIIATDSGSPARSATGVMIVKIVDVNERVEWTTSRCLAGSTDEFVSCMSIKENTPPSSAAAVLQSVKAFAHDPDVLAQQSLNFTVELEGNVKNGKKLFGVDPVTGVMSVRQNELNHEESDSWIVTVVATDNGRPTLSNSARVHVFVEDVNEAPILEDGAREVPENSRKGVPLAGLVVGKDVDDGVWGELGYDIVGGSGAGVFAIDRKTGEISVNETAADDLNFESLDKSKYSLMVRVTDGGQLTARATYTVVVTDVNEPPRIDDAVRSIKENTLAPGKAGSPVTGTDPDNAHPVLGVRQQILYTIIGGDGAGLFKIDTCSGQIEVRDRAVLNFEMKNQYNLTVEARDDVQPVPLTDTATVTINLIDDNDAPVITVPVIEGVSGYVLEIEELAPVGTPVISADGKITRLEATDEDINSRTQAWAQLRWSIKAGNNLGIWAIDEVTGVLSLAEANRLDFEDDDVNKFTLTVSVCDGGSPAKCDETVVNINVLNSNEPPSLDDSTVIINETTRVGQKLYPGQQAQVFTGGDLAASDPDGPEAESKLRFFILDGNQLGHFAVANTGRQARIIVTDKGASELNFEKISSYVLKVQVVDEGGLNDNATVTVKVTDLNERPELADITVDIDENSVRGTKVALTKDLVQDPDCEGTTVAACAETQKYEIVNQVPAGVFRIDGSSGELEVDRESIDFETINFHIVSVRVKDSKGLVSPTATWRVNVNDMQERPTLRSVTFNGVEENSGVGTIVGTVTGSDPDAADAGRLRFEIRGQETNAAGHSPFVITDEFKGTLAVAAQPSGSDAVLLDFETKAKYAIQVAVIDTASNEHVDTVYVELDEVNEPPRLATNGSVIAAREGELGQINSIVSMVFDEDVGDSFTFEILSGDSCTDGTKVAKIDASTGMISFITRFVPCVQVFEAVAAAGQQAYDANHPDFDNKLDLMIRITDTRGLSTVNHLIVKIAGSNERPQFIAPSAPVRVPENSAVGTTVLTIYAVDPDFARQSLTYSMSARGRNVNRPFPFRIETQTADDADRAALASTNVNLAPWLRQKGVITIDGPVDFEGEFSTYEVTISATDSDALPFTGSIDITIGLTDVNEIPTFVMGSLGGAAGYVATIPENSFQGVQLGGDRVTATDVDSDDQGLRLRYSLLGDNAVTSLFSIVQFDGVLVFRGLPSDVNFEDSSRNEYSMTVQVEDTAGNKVTRPLTVKVEDVNEKPVLQCSEGTRFEIQEGSAFGTVAGTCSAVDDDSVTSARGQLRFSISKAAQSSTDDSVMFEISSTGVISVKQAALDWENQDSFVFVVTVRDGDASAPLSDSRTVFVDLTNVNDISIGGFSVSQDVEARGLGWNVPKDAAEAVRFNSTYNGAPIDWSRTHSAMQVVGVTPGGATVLITGTNLGKTASRIQRERETHEAQFGIGTYSGNAGTTYKVTYGPVRGTKYTASNCRRASSENTAILCDKAEGAGVNHIWIVSVQYEGQAAEHKQSSSTRTGYAPPLVTAARSLNVATFSTEGGQRFELTGVNFGPSTYLRPTVDGSGMESVPVNPIVRYGPETGMEYRATNCSFSRSHTGIQCDTVPGIGAHLKFVVTADGQSSNPFASALSYSPPVIERVSQNVLATQGGDFITLFGKNFGPIGTAGIVAEYHKFLRPSLGGMPEGVKPYVAVACKVDIDAPHRRVVCSAAPGIGREHSWRITVGGQTSSVSESLAELTSQYKPPVISKIGGIGADMADTKGGQEVLISGANFGPATPTDSNGNLVSLLAPIAVYGHDDSTYPAYTARSCRVAVPHEQIVCLTTEGTGKDLFWSVEVGEQRTDMFLLMPTNYHPPVVAFYRGPGATDAHTAGQELVIIEGRNFGKVGTVVQNATYGQDSAEFSAQNCVVEVAHTQINCLTSVGAGDDLTWSITIDEQASVSPTTDYHIPEIFGFGGIAARDASTDGGQEIIVFGNWFSIDRYLESVTYGPTGSEFRATNCRVTVPHEEIRCKTVPGTGRVLRWIVTVKGQASSLSQEFTSYAIPTINSTFPLSVDTAGGQDVTISGRNFGIKWPLSQLEVLMNARGHEAPARALIDEHFAALWDGDVSRRVAEVEQWLATLERPEVRSATARKDGTHVVQFQTTEGFGKDLELLLMVDGVPSSLQTISYDPPHIDNIAPDRQEVDAGLLRVFVEGSSFCNGEGGCGAVFVDGVPVAVEIWQHNLVMFIIPDPANADNALICQIVVAGQASQAVPFKKPVPNFNALVGQGKWYEMSTLGGEEFFITGVSDIDTVPESDVTVRLGPYLCLNTQGQPGIARKASVTDQDRRDNVETIWCITPPGAGADLPVIIEVPGGRSRASELTFTYKAPVITHVMDAQNLLSSEAMEFLMDSSRDAMPWLSPSRSQVASSIAADLYSIERTYVDFSGDAIKSTFFGNNKVTASAAARYHDDLVTLMQQETAKIVDDETNGLGGIPTLKGTIAVILGSGLGANNRSGLFLSPDVEPPVTAGSLVMTVSHSGEPVPVTVLHQDDSILIVQFPSRDGRRHPLQYVVQNQGSNDLKVRYRRPTVSQVAYTNAPTRGSFSVTVTGKDFGLGSQTIMVGGSQCTNVRDMRQETSAVEVLECSSPAGQGRNLPVTVTVRGETSVVHSESRYSYNRPAIASLSRNHGPTSGRAFPRFTDDFYNVIAEGNQIEMEMYGEDFGMNGTIAFVKKPTDDPLQSLSPEQLLQVEEIPVPASYMLEHTHEKVRFYMPEGLGKHLEVVLSVGGQYPRSQPVHFSYDSPTIQHILHADRPPAACKDRERSFLVTNLDGSVVVEKKNVSAECYDTRGTYSLFIVGESFGSRGWMVSIGGSYICTVTGDEVRVNGRVVESLRHNRLKCIVPQGLGDQLPVRVTWGDRETYNVHTNVSVFSYDPPIVMSLMPNTPDALRERVVIRGKNFGWVPTPVTILINEKPCKDATWLNDGSLECMPEADVVGPKNVSILVANRTTPEVIRDFESMFVTECKAPLYYGLRGEECLKCSVDAKGANCTHGDEQLHDMVVSLPGWWRFNLTAGAKDRDIRCHEKRKHREGCPYFAPCEPKWACLGNNLCAEGYTSARCSECVKGKYYRINGECEKCPDQPWLIFVLFFLAAVFACFGAWMLNSRQVNVAFIAIGIDYFQVLAMFARARVRWPPLLKGIFRWLSAFNLNIELAAPECAIPEVTYSMKWFLTICLPIAAIVVLGLMYLSGYAWKTFIKQAAANRRHEHGNALISVFVIMMYIGYLSLTRMTLDVFNCGPTDPPDGQLYMSGQTDVVCFESPVHLTLFPFALLSFGLYVAAMPVFALVLLRRNKLIVKRDQICRALAQRDSRYKTMQFMTRDVWVFRRRFNRLYYLFRPGKAPYWIGAILLRKFLVAFTALMFRTTPSYQLAFALLVMFAAYVLQARNSPYMSPSDYDHTVRHHLLQADIAETLGKQNDHWRIRESMLEVESRYTTMGSTTGAWREAAVGAAMADLDEEKQLNVSFAMFLVDYNAVESVLLGCAVLVNLAGIMFLSNRFNDPELMDYYVSEYNQLAVVAATLIMLSVVYFLVLLAFEIFFMLNPERAAWCVSLCTSRASRKKMASQVSGTDEKSKAANSSSAKKSGSTEIVMQQSALVTAEASTGEGMTRTAMGVLDAEEPPNRLQWGVVRSHARTLQQSVEDLREEVRKLKMAAHGGAVTAAAKAFRSGKGSGERRARTFGARPVRGGASEGGESPNPLFAAAAKAVTSRRVLAPIKTDMTAMNSMLTEVATPVQSAAPSEAAASASTQPKKKGNKKLFKDDSLPEGWIGVEKTKDDGSTVVYYWHRATNKISKTKPEA